MFPDGWETRVLGSRKKRRLVSSSKENQNTIEEDNDDPVQHPAEEHAGNAHPLTSSIMQQLYCNTSTPPVPGDLDLDYILSRVPYRNILESIMST